MKADGSILAVEREGEWEGWAGGEGGEKADWDEQKRMKASLAKKGFVCFASGIKVWDGENDVMTTKEATACKGNTVEKMMMVTMITAYNTL